MSRTPLRVGLLVDSLVQPRWIETALREIERSGVASVAVVVRRRSAPAPVVGRWRRLWSNRRLLLYTLHARLDARRFRQEPDPFAPVDLAPLLTGADMLDVAPRETRHCDYFQDADVERIRAYDLDVAVRFGFRILKGDALRIARYGVWSYHHGDNFVNRGGPAGFWEVMEGHPTTGSILQVLTEELDAGHVLYRSWAATDQSSVTRNRRNYYWKSAQFLPRMLRRLYEDGPSALRDASEREVWAPYSARLYMRPENREMLGLIVKRAWRKVRRRARATLSQEQWCLGYLFARGSTGGDGPIAPALHKARLLVPARDRFWADPFIVRQDDRYFVFFEEYLRSVRRAHISVMELGPKGPIGEPVRVLERDYHLSYPYVFRWGDTYWMIPETEGNKTVELYRATSFPTGWELDTVLMRDVSLVDATVFERDGRWWMFGNVAPAGISSWDELSLFHADSPRGPWIPHPRNPVVSDVRSARPAGRPFCWRGQWYRPSQDCSTAYGSAIVINRIDQLDTERYRETPVARLDPSWRRDLTGLHTLDMTDGLTMIDVRLRRRRW